MIAAPERRSPDQRRAEAARRSVAAIREAAATAASVALTYDHIASAADAVDRVDPSALHRDRAVRARRRAAEERREALRTWARAAALEAVAD